MVADVEIRRGPGICGATELESILASLRPASERLLGISVDQSPSRDRMTCRCGTRTAKGSPVIRVLNIRGPVASLFQGRGFCSVKCLRAFCLESLEQLDGLDTPEAEATVTDLHELNQAMSVAYAEILHAL
jgi:hypothetical protein